MALLALTIINLSNAVMIESEVTPHNGNRNTEIIINYTLDPSVTSDARIKLYLDKYDSTTNGFDSNIDKTIIDYFEIDPLNTSPVKIYITDESSWFYRICMRLAHNSKYYTDCDSNNQFLLLDDTPITTNLLLPEQSITLNAESPVIVNLAEEFTINVSIKNTGAADLNLNIYSYALNNTKKVSEGDWDSNSQSFLISSNSIVNATLRNKISYNGTFNLRIRAEYNGKKVDITREIIVINSQYSRLIMDKPVLVNDKIRVTVTNLGTITENVTMNLYTNKGETITNLLLIPRTCKEVFIEATNVTGFIKSTLYYNNILILNTDTFINKTFNNDESTIKYFEEKINNSLQTSDEENALLLISNQTSNTSNSRIHLIDDKTTKISTETLLYSLIVGVSLISGYVVIKKI